ncbi:DUF1684 domain-containing protein [bacterium]|nr:DUF1684 domain-containing protein [bacterium]
MRLTSAILAACLTGLLLALSGCGGDPAPGPVAMDESELERWEIALVEWRIEKNEEFMQPERTPLPGGMLEDFVGLDYYFPARDFRYRVPLEVAARPDTVMLARREGEQVPYVVAGSVRFRHDDRDHRLTVYRSTDPDVTTLFLPFFDETNGGTTYPGGRYLDLDPAADGTVELDFNKAYNPLCAYDPEAWNCTLPPEENRLPLPVEAGEKLLTSSGH